MKAIQEAIQQIEENPRSAGYKDHRHDVRKLKKRGIWDELANDESWQYLHKISDLFSIPYSTLKTWYYNLHKDPFWIPHDPDNYPDLIFTDAEKSMIADFIHEIYLSHNQPISNELIKNILIAFWSEIPQERKKGTMFTASDEYLSKFREYIVFSIRKAHSKRRPEISQEDIDSFFIKAKDIISSADPDHVLNTDETFWRCEPSGLYTWAPKGIDGVVIHSQGNEKIGFTTLATIDLDGNKYPLDFIASGKTNKAEENWFGKGRNIANTNDDDIEEIEDPTFKSKTRKKMFKPKSVTDHSDSGWVNIDVWKRYLYKLRYSWVKPKRRIDFYDKKNRIYLFCDAYPVHHCAEAIEYATMLNIELIKIPEGSTDLYQPLDVRLFGSLKARLRSYFNKKRCDLLISLFDPVTLTFTNEIPISEPMSRREASSFMEIEWNNLHIGEIFTAWHIAIKQYLPNYTIQKVQNDDDTTFIQNVKNIFQKQLKLIDENLTNNVQIYEKKFAAFNSNEKNVEIFTSNLQVFLQIQKIFILLFELCKEESNPKILTNNKLSLFQNDVIKLIEEHENQIGLFLQSENDFFVQTKKVPKIIIKESNLFTETENIIEKLIPFGKYSSTDAIVESSCFYEKYQKIVNLYPNFHQTQKQMNLHREYYPTPTRFIPQLPLIFQNQSPLTPPHYSNQPINRTSPQGQITLELQLQESYSRMSHLPAPSFQISYAPANRLVPQQSIDFTSQSSPTTLRTYSQPLKPNRVQPTLAMQLHASSSRLFPQFSIDNSRRQMTQPRNYCQPLTQLTPQIPQNIQNQTQMMFK